MEPTKKTIGDYIKQIGAYGILITFFAIGFAIAGAFWSSTVSELNYQIGQTRIELNNRTDELNQVKTDYLSYKTINESMKQSSNNPILQDTLIKNTTAIEVKRINTEKSYSFFSGELTISLIATPFEGNPLRHKVLANINSPNGVTRKVENEDIGMVIDYKGERTYQITILEAETFSATFQVRKI